jgi:hypothetical protein
VSGLVIISTPFREALARSPAWSPALASIEVKKKLPSIEVIGSSDAKAGSSGIALAYGQGKRESLEEVAEHRGHRLVGRQARQVQSNDSFTRLTDREW